MIALLLLLWCGLAGAAPVEIQLWHAYRGAERAALEGLVDRYESRHPGLRVQVLALPYESFESRLETATPRGNGPDLFIEAHERLGSQVASGLVAAVPGGLHGFIPATREAVEVGGRAYGWPLAFKCLALFVNRDLLPEPPSDTREMLAAARRLSGGGSYGLAYEATSAYHHAAWMHGFGGGVFRDGAVALDQQANARALAFVRGMLDAGILPQEPTSALVTRLFNQGRAAMVVNGPWFLGEIAPGVDFEVAPLPVVSETGLPAAPYLTVEAAMVPVRASHPAEARALAAWLAGPEAARTRAIEGRQAVALLSAWDDPEVARDPVLAAFRAQAERSVPMPNRPEMALTWEPQARALRRVLRGASDPETAVARAQHEYEVVSRPPPPPAEPAPYVAGLAVLLLGGLSWGWRRRGRARGLRRWGFAYGWVAPAAVSMLLLVVVPFVVGAAVAFFAHRGGEWSFVGLRNFADILLARDWPITSPLSFWFTLGVTVLWTASNVALHVVIGVALALLLRDPWVRLRGVYRVLLVLPWAVPSYITALIWKGMFHRQFGAINGLLSLLGLEPVSWFSRFSTAFGANLATNTWLGFPFMMVVTLGALQSIPRELEQAAEVDGASRWQRFRHVTLPLLEPALLPAVVLGSIWTFNMFNVIYLVSGGEPDGATEILISDAWRWAFTRNYRYGYAAAYAVLIFFVLLGWSRFTGRLLARRPG